MSTRNLDKLISPRSVVAIGANGQTSNMATTTYTLSDSHYDGPEPITNLRIGGYVGTSPGQFLGRDIVLKWNAPTSAAFFNPSFQDYAIEVLIELASRLKFPAFTHADGSRKFRDYPDFIVKTKAGRIIALETKGDDRDNHDSELKLKLGKLWEAKAGRLTGPGCRYMMVFDNNPIDGAERLSDALAKIRQL